jgi:hypothetical protein
MSQFVRYVCACVLIVLPSVTRADTAPRTPVTIRVYNHVGLSRSSLATALQFAGDVLRGADIEPTWRTCRLSNAASRSLRDRCDDPLRPTELMVRLVVVPRVTTGLSGFSLGFSYVDSQAHAGILSTVFADRVQAAAHLAGIERALLLGRTVAHEIGHLLMGATAHTDHGLMQQDWSLAFLQRATPLDWRFSDEETTRMGRGLLARRSARSDLAARVTVPMSGLPLR